MRKAILSRITVWAILACGFLAVSAEAQEFRAKLQGVVTDTSTSVVVGATVTLTNTKTGVEVVRTTNETGRYRFDFVDAGSYKITVESSGFSRFVQENIVAQALADISVDAVLKPGNLQQTITVVETPVAISFNSTSNVLTVDSKLAEEVPRLDRNPFKLDLLNPAVQDTRRNEMAPYHSWAANSTELGGGTDKKNDLQVDGSPIGSGYKASYVPNTDSVQEVSVQQNAVDAESGHSAGGAISMTMKSGTNQYHGSLFYLGRNPKLNAVTDRTTNIFTANRNNMWGATLGSPIKRNKLFNFASYEQWKPRTPGASLMTMPTDLERLGDFSKSLNINGAMAVIYDPYTTKIDAAGKVTRQAFAGNIIPSSRFDPISVRVMKELWKPNRAPDNITGLNNFADSTKAVWNYWNFSDKVDWFINDKLRVYGRYSLLKTTQTTATSILSGSELYIPGGSLRNAWTYAGDGIYTISPTTIVNFHYTKQGLDDDFYAPDSDLNNKGGLGTIWPNNPWYKPYDQANIAEFFPAMSFGGASVGRTKGWFQHPGGYAFSGKISRQAGAHFLKAGGEFRHSGGISVVGGGKSFAFSPAMTADTFLKPNTTLVGNGFASFLLGALNNDTSISIKPNRGMETELYGFFVQDDFNLNRRISLNLGLRYELDSPWHDPDHTASIGLDLSQPNTVIQQNPFVLPSQVTGLRTAAPIYNGAWQFTSDSHPGSWDYQKLVLMPRIGMALKVNDRTAFRVGWARFVSPHELDFIGAAYSGAGNTSFLEAPLMGFDASQNPLPLDQGIPQATLSNPFPATSPLIAPPGKKYGQYEGLGEANAIWAASPNVKRLVNDRINVTISRQLPGQIMAEATYFLNFGRNVAYAYNFNASDPAIGYKNPALMDVSVANPFYNYLTQDKFPGPLRNQPTVAIKTLLSPYPQYGGLWTAYRSDGGERYRALQLKVQRPFRGGYNFLAGYNYRREINTVNYDEVAAYQQKLTWQDASTPRHSMTLASSYEFPFGRGRSYLNHMPRVLNAIIGGWQSTGATYFNSGNYLRFGPLVASGNPVLENPTPQRWFDTSAFKILPAYTPRTNPWQYPGLKGPVYWNIDATLGKAFVIREGVRAELKMAAYNLTNHFNRADPVVTVTSTDFGKAIRQASNLGGRQMEFGLKILF